jgi:hypothetical protein
MLTHGFLRHHKKNKIQVNLNRRQGNARKLLASSPDPACAFQLTINDGTTTSCTAFFPGNSTQTISFGGVTSTLQALVERTQRLELSCTLSGEAPLQIPSGCLAAVAP